MSVHVISWVLRNSTATLGDRLVLIALADKAEEDGTNARPSVPTLSNETCLSERQVQRCLRNLENSARILKTGTYKYPGQKNGVNVYTVRMGPDNMSPFEPPKGDIRDSQTVTPTSPNPSLEPVLEPIAPAAQDSPFDAPELEPHERGLFQRKPRKRDPIWDTLAEIFGEPQTRTEQTLRGKTVSSLRMAKASPTEIMARAQRWPQHFDTATLTPEALEKHWTALGRKPLRRR